MQPNRHARRRRSPFDPHRRPIDGFRALRPGEFDRMVDQAIATLPKELLQRVDNLQVVVEDVPPPDVMGTGEDEVLLGLYQGVPLTERDNWGAPLPDVITIYRRPIEMRARSRADLAELVREVVLHEIAHHFGIDDDRLDELGW